MENFNDDPVEMNEPERFERNESVWMRGLWMLVFLFFFALGETILGVLTLIQFLWMLFAKEKNASLVQFGSELGGWMRDVARFQTGETDDKPFPWKGWNA